MRILNISLGDDGIEWAAHKAGHKMITVDFNDLLRNKHMGIGALQQHIKLAFDQFKPDLVWMQIQREGIIWNTTASHMKKKAVVLNWTGDVRENIDWYLALAPHVSATLFTNWDDVRKVRESGCQSGFLQIGYDERKYFYREGSSRNGVVFLGNNYPGVFPNTALRLKEVNRLRAHCPEFRLYGNGWGRDVKATNEFSELNVYNSSKLSVSIEHFTREGYASDRVLRSMACGCPVVQLTPVDLTEQFPFMIYDSVEVALSNYNPKIAKQVADHTRANHTWHNRLKEIEQIVAEL